MRTMLLSLLLSLLRLQWCFADAAALTGNGSPSTFMWDGAAMLAVRNSSRRDPALQPVLEQLAADAALAAEQGPWSVMEKPLTPPSGDKHDYMSVGSYWWPCTAVCNATLFAKPGECAAWNDSDLGAPLASVPARDCFIFLVRQNE